MQMAGVALVTVGLALAWLPLGLVFLGGAVFGLGWLLDHDTFMAEDVEE